MFESFRDRDLKDTGSCDEPGAGAPVGRARGTTRESWIEGAKQKHTQREGLYDLRRPELGLEESVTGFSITEDMGYENERKYVLWK